MPDICTNENYTCPSPKICVTDIVATVAMCLCPEGTYGPDCSGNMSLSS